MGYTVATSVLARAASADLTDLASVRTELALKSADTSKDVWIAKAIRRASQSIASETNRSYVPELVQDVFDIRQDAYPAQTPGGFPEIVLSRYPVVSIESVTQATTIDQSTSLTEGTDWRYDEETGRLLRLNRFTGGGSAWEAAPLVVRYVAGFGETASDSADVPASAPHTVTAVQADDYSCDRSVTYADGTALARVTVSPAEGEYSVDASTGVYTFAAADAGAAVVIAYAVRAIPADLEDACLRLVVGRFHNMGRDPALVERDTPGVGKERWWFGGAPGQQGPFPPDIAGLLENYRMPVVA